ncbi:D-ribose pyranase [Alkalibacillus salilacus]|uniref:D-ribose pyranase n=1 Tax=Alkalibacillus salilacus TaxID=284582 RepID=A0ABT9VHR8_9BACI|nr:D-ribose pyranase [Alkalibacillus salilacus]MDQ0160498.1 D-ribose pyranase [Alkalibacillus salilacus]
MKKQGVLNSDIATVLASLGHTDTIVISDCGLPVPDHVPRIDLALKKGQPRFTDTLEVVLSDMEVEHITLAEEIKTSNADVQKEIFNQYSGEVDYVSHERFKELTQDAKVVIRTGEVTPFANVILRAGVIF